MGPIIFNIEILCKPCSKCLPIQEKITTIVHNLGMKNSVPMKCNFTFNKDIRAAEKRGYNVANLPITVINGEVAFTGCIRKESVIRLKILELMKGGDAI